MKQLSVAALDVAAICTFFIGCRSLGAGTVVRDRFDYTEAIGDSRRRGKN